MYKYACIFFSQEGRAQRWQKWSEKPPDYSWGMLQKTSLELEEWGTTFCLQVIFHPPHPLLGLPFLLPFFFLPTAIIW